MNSISQRIDPDYNSNGIKVPTIDSLEDLISHLRDIFDSDHVNTDYVEALMKSYKSNKLDWQKYAKFDEYKYTRNLVDEGNGKYNLMILCWGEGHGSAIHDHADAHCFMKILEGSLSEVRFAWPEEVTDQNSEDDDVNEAKTMQETSRTYLKKNAVCYMNDSLGLHRVENPSHTDKTVSLHLYSPPFSSCSMFDQRTGHRSKGFVTFWTKYGEKVTYNKGDETSKQQVPEDN